MWTLINGKSGKLFGKGFNPANEFSSMIEIKLPCSSIRALSVGQVGSKNVGKVKVVERSLKNRPKVASQWAILHSKD